VVAIDTLGFAVDPRVAEFRESRRR
jgi:hypothetical protein